MRVEVFDGQGRRVRSLVDREYGPGEWEASWDGTDDGGRPLKRGVYLTRVQFVRSEVEQSKQLVILQ